MYVHPTTGMSGNGETDWHYSLAVAMNGGMHRAQDQKQEAGVSDEDAGLEDKLLGIAALEGKELNEAGEILDDADNIRTTMRNEEVKHKIAAGEIDLSTLRADEAGQIVDEEGNVLDRVDPVEGPAKDLAAIHLDVRILGGKKVNKKGKILDEDGEEVGELCNADGELAAHAGKKINASGEVVDKDGNVLGRVCVISGEAAENATKALLEELGTNEKGQALNEQGVAAEANDQNRTKSNSSSADILKQATQATEYNKQLSCTRTHRATYIDDHWQMRPRGQLATPAETQFDGYSIPGTPPDVFLHTRDAPEISEEFWPNYIPDQLFPYDGNGLFPLQSPSKDDISVATSGTWPGLVPQSADFAPELEKRDLVDTLLRRWTTVVV